MGPVRGALRAARTGFLAQPQAIASASAAGFGFTCRGQPPVAALSLCPSTSGGPTGELAQHAAPLRAVSNVGYTSGLNSGSRTPSFFRGRWRTNPCRWRAGGRRGMARARSQTQTANRGKGTELVTAAAQVPYGYELAYPSAVGRPHSLVTSSNVRLSASSLNQKSMHASCASRDGPRSSSRICICSSCRR